VKLADKPDSVRLPFLRKTNVTAINLGRGSPRRLNATYPPALRNHINAGLLGIAARRDCPFHPDWTGSSLLLWSSPCGGEVLPPTLSCAVRTFLQCLVSQIAPAAVWRASRDWLSAQTACFKTATRTKP